MTKIINDSVVEEDDKEELTATTSKYAHEPKRMMEDIIKSTPVPPEAGVLVEGTVIGKEKMSIYVDIPPFGTGIIYGREYLNAKDLIKKINLGDLVTAKIVEAEGEKGYIELSLKEAKQAIVWSEAEKAIKSKEIYELLVKDANKGGLIMEWQGLDGFLPSSQLKPEHYPRIPDGDKDRIMEELKKFVGAKLSVTIIGADAKEGKLIFSEKNSDLKSKREIVEKYSLGDVILGEVTGAVDFGIFLKIEDGLEGLVHISEIDWALVENPKELFKIGDKVKTKVIEIKDGKISLSLKALKENPWNEASKKYKKGEVVKGVVIKYNKHGALVSIEEGVAGLVHISEFQSEEDLRSKLELGKTYTFTINLFEPKDQRMTLSYGEKREETPLEPAPIVA
ncbi:MAG: S1 RNA-binding domain-containing protein [Patescibacteria group bacterium]